MSGTSQAAVQLSDQLEPEEWLPLFCSSGHRIVEVSMPVDPGQHPVDSLGHLGSLELGHRAWSDPSIVAISGSQISTDTQYSVPAITRLRRLIEFGIIRDSLPCYSTSASIQTPTENSGR